MSGAKAKRRSAPENRDLSQIPASQLQAELARRRRRVRTLTRRRDRLLKSAKALDAEIAALGAPAGAVAGPGRRNAVNLVQALKRALSDKPMSVSEAAEAVLKGGYRTTSPSFRQIVNVTLIRSGVFERVGRGRYRVKE